MPLYFPLGLLNIKFPNQRGCLCDMHLKGEGYFNARKECKKRIQSRKEGASPSFDALLSLFILKQIHPIYHLYSICQPGHSMGGDLDMLACFPSHPTIFCMSLRVPTFCLRTYPYFRSFKLIQLIISQDPAASIDRLSNTCQDFIKFVHNINPMLKLALKKQH